MATRFVTEEAWYRTAYEQRDGGADPVVSHFSADGSVSILSVDVGRVGSGGDGGRGASVHADRVCGLVERSAVGGRGVSD